MVTLHVGFGQAAVTVAGTDRPGGVLLRGGSLQNTGTLRPRPQPLLGLYMLQKRSAKPNDATLVRGPLAAAEAGKPEPGPRHEKHFVRTEDGSSSIVRK